MKNRFSVASLLLVLTLLLPLFASCHGSRGLEPFTMPDAPDTSRDYEITFWAKNDTNKAQTTIYENAIAGFEALYPNVHVTIRLYTDYGKIYNDVITNISTGTTPNVCITYPDHIATYMTGSNVVVPLDGLMNDPVYGLGGSGLLFDSPAVGEIVPQFLSECVIGGETFAMPFMRSTEACYINRDFVEKLGYTVPDVLTWDFIWEVSEAAAAKDADGTYLLNGQKVLIPFIYKSTDNMMISYLKQIGAPYSDENGGILCFNDSTAGLLYTVAEHTAGGAFSTFKISGYPANYLNAGQCVFAVDSTAGATWMGSGAPNVDIAEESIIDFETIVRPIPQADPDRLQMISQGPSVCLFNKSDPQEVLVSWLFLQYLLTNDVQIAYSSTEGYVPVTTKAQQDPGYREYLSSKDADDAHYTVKLQAAKLLLDHLGDTFVTPVWNGSTSLRDAAGQMIENTVKGIRRGQTVDGDFITKLYGDVTSLYRLDSTGSSVGQKAELGPLPAPAKALLITLAVVWTGIAVFAVIGKRKELRKFRRMSE